MPVIPSYASVLTQTIDASLDSAGTLTGSLIAESDGQSARRGLYEHGSPDRYKAEMERYLSYYIKGAAVKDVKAKDSFDANRFSSSLKFASGRYAQLMQNRMLVFHLAIVEPSAMRLPAVQDRVEPIILNGRTYRKHVLLKLPAGFTVDEMPSPFTAEAPFARFSVAYRQEAGQLIMDEELRTEAVTLPAAGYAQVKKFFDQVYGADSQNAVLIKN